MDRRNFIKTLAAATSAAALAACDSKSGRSAAAYQRQTEPPTGKMTYRRNHNTGDKVSILGYGMMRLPTIDGGSDVEGGGVIDQDMVNRQVDYALAHGINYFDTAPVYCEGRSEQATGTALHRHKRSEYLVATKLSNFDPATWARAESIKMFENSLRYLQVDYVDYLLLHAIGQGKDALAAFNGRYMDNGVLDYLVAQQRAGRIRNLGFSYHGDIRIFDMLLRWHDEGRYHWDFVQIQLNYLDWHYARQTNARETDAIYLYGELAKRHIPAVIMEPLRGGALANVPQYIADQMKERRPEDSVAAWAFRYAGTPEGVLTVLSGMTYMDHLKDNLRTYCPLQPITKDEDAFLMDVARQIFDLKNIPCTGCQYCMPCPYGVNIPALFAHYNKCKNEGALPHPDAAAVSAGQPAATAEQEDYARLRRRYLISLDRAVPRQRQPDHCIGCGTCVEHCPQHIDIPARLHEMSETLAKVKRDMELA